MLSAAGRALLDELADQEAGPDQVLALAESLRRRHPADLVSAALSMRVLLVAARAKFSAADQMLVTRAGLEQASSELTARHAAARFAQARLVADLCCGIGGNLIALASTQTTEATHATKVTPAADSARTDGPLGALQAPQRAVGGAADRGSRGTDAHQRSARRVIAVDADLTSLEFARHNASVCAPGAEVGYVCADVTRLSLTGIDAVFIDPARRDDGRRLPAGACQPPLGWCLRLAESVPAVGIKAAPGLRRDLVPPGWETEFVAVGRELKEALLWSPALATDGELRAIGGSGPSGSGVSLGDKASGQHNAPTSQHGGGSRGVAPTSQHGGEFRGVTPTGQHGGEFRGVAPTGQHGGEFRGVAPTGRHSVSRATVLPSGDTMAARADAATPPVRLAPPGAFLIDPSPAVTRAGLVAELAHRTGGWQIDPMIAFLACDVPVGTPFGRTLRVLDSAPWHEKRFAGKLRELGIGSLDIRRRGLAGDVAQIQQRLGLRGSQRGGGAATLVLTRVNDRPWGLICVQPDTACP